MAFLLYYLLGGCWTALALSIHGRTVRQQRMDGDMATLVILTWPVLLLLAVWELFDDALMGVDSEAEHG